MTELEVNVRVMLDKVVTEIGFNEAVFDAMEVTDETYSEMINRIVSSILDTLVVAHLETGDILQMEEVEVIVLLVFNQIIQGEE